MALSTFVYLRDVDNLSDARYAAGMGVDLIGFKLDPNDDSSLTSDRFKEVSEWISGVKFVGEFGNSNPEEVQSLIDKFNIHYILVSDASQIQSFSLLGLPLILKIDCDVDTDCGSTLNYCSDMVDFFLLESNKNTLDNSDKKFLIRHGAHYPILIGFGIDENNSRKIIEEYNLRGISLRGSPEMRPGYKDFDELTEILESLEID